MNAPSCLNFTLLTDGAPLSNVLEFTYNVAHCFSRPDTR